MTVTPDNLAVLAYLESEIGETDDIAAYYDENNSASIDIAWVPDSPEDGLNTFFTLALSDADIDLSVDGKDLGVEIVFGARKEFNQAANIVSTCALNVINDDFDIEPDTIFLNVVAMYYPQSVMKHVLFVDPFTWELKSQNYAQKVVAFLQAIPISNAEKDLVDTKGANALHEILEQQQVDVFDLNRPSVV